MVWARQPAGNIARRSFTNKMLFAMYLVRSNIWSGHLLYSDTYYEIFNKTQAELNETGIKGTSTNDTSPWWSLYARPHASLITSWKLHQLQWDLTAQSLNSPDMALQITVCFPPTALSLKLNLLIQQKKFLRSMFFLSSDHHNSGRKDLKIFQNVGRKSHNSILIHFEFV